MFFWEGTIIQKVDLKKGGLGVRKFIVLHLQLLAEDKSSNESKISSLEEHAIHRRIYI